MKKISAAAAELGRKGGKSTSDAKRRAARKNGKKGGRPSQEAIIAANHQADVENGLSEKQASESDAFERRVLGLEDDNQHDRYGDAGYSGCYD